jgi:hypothetical protein
LAFPPIRKRGRSGSPQPQRGISNGTLARRDAAGWCARGPVRQRPSGQSRGKSASGSAKKRRTLRSAKRGTECDLRESRSFSHAPDCHRNGQDYRLGSRQRIERVAGRQLHHSLAVAFVSFEALTSIVHLIDLPLFCEFARQAASSSRLSLVASIVVAHIVHWSGLLTCSNRWPACQPSIPKA